MADIKKLEDKVVNAEAKVEKCKGTIERHKKQLDKKIQKVVKEVGLDLTGKSKEEIDELREPYRTTEHSWTIYEVVNKLDDIKGAEKKLGEAEHILANWREKLDIEVNREKFIQENAPKVIVEFLEEWKKLAYEWYIKRYNDYQEFKNKLRVKHDKEIISFVKSHPEDFERYLEDGEIASYWANSLGNIHGAGLKKHMEEKGLDYSSMNEKKANFAGGAVMYMDSIYDEEKRLAWLEDTLEQERKAKLLDLIFRISKVVGEIEDATYLKINEKGNLDGFVIGNKGKARVETIGAGGWNIQCWHYRTLVKPVKEA